MVEARWAAKEAAIKAHSHRRLYMPHISIIKEMGSPRPVMLIDPPSSIVSLTAEVAEQRQIDTKGRQKLDREEVQKLGVSVMDSSDVGQMYWRYKKINMEERQLADLSISHDGEYAFAVVQALDVVLDDTQPLKVIKDDGAGDPIHEPQHGDRGFLELRSIYGKEDLQLQEHAGSSSGYVQKSAS